MECCCFRCYLVHAVFTGFLFFFFFLLGYYVVFTLFHGDFTAIAHTNTNHPDISPVIVTTHRGSRRITSQNLDKRGDRKFEKNTRNKCSQTQVLTQNMYERHYSTPAIVSLKCSPVSVQDSPNANRHNRLD